MLGLVQTLKQTKPVGSQEWDLCSPGKPDMLRGKAGIPLPGLPHGMSTSERSFA